MRRSGFSRRYGRRFQPFNIFQRPGEVPTYGSYDAGYLRLDVGATAALIGAAVAAATISWAGMAQASLVGDGVPAESPLGNLTVTASTTVSFVGAASQGGALMSPSATAGDLLATGASQFFAFGAVDGTISANLAATAAGTASVVGALRIAAGLSAVGVATASLVGSDGAPTVLRSDNFNRSDSASNPNSPSDGGSNWVLVEAGHGPLWGILSNELYRSDTNADNHSVLYLETGATNVSVSIKMSPPALFQGPNARFVDLDNRLFFDISTLDLTGIRIGKVVGGAVTALDTDTVSAVQDGDILKLTVVGSAVTGYINGSPVLTGDLGGDLTTGTKCGLYNWHDADAGAGAGDGRYDDFLVETA